MNLTINGTVRQTDPNSVLSLLESLNVHPQTVVVEFNGEIIRREDYGTQLLSEGDTLEIVQMMAGG
jgi:sulfur carrier protein